SARSFLVHDVEKLELFDRAFNLFWMQRVEWVVEFGVARQKARREPRIELPESEEAPLSRRQGSQMGPPEEAGDDDPSAEPSVASTYSPVEILYRKDFSDYSKAELEAAVRFIRSLPWRLDSRLTRRKVRSIKRASYLDLRRSVRDSMKYGGEIVELVWRRRKPKPRPLVVICDISGSMERYSRLFLHYMYALAQGPQKVELFVFGTRLTCITPALRRNDVDTAVTKMSDLVLDWSGGTRIGESLKTFNYKWARRKLGRGAVVIVISDGWDRGNIQLLESEIARLRRSVSRLIWLNPLSGAPGYRPLVLGMQAVLPYVDDFLPLNNLLSLEQLAARLGALLVRT
ncbi:MAG TPA: VWA domain-containing protein, partial [Anaerolineales bacterium]